MRKMLLISCITIFVTLCSNCVFSMNITESEIQVVNKDVPIREIKLESDESFSKYSDMKDEGDLEDNVFVNAATQSIKTLAYYYRKKDGETAVSDLKFFGDSEEHIGELIELERNRLFNICAEYCVYKGKYTDPNELLNAMKPDYEKFLNIAKFMAKKI